MFLRGSLLLLLFNYLFSNVYGQEDKDGICGLPIVIQFVNGINTTLNEANVQTRNLDRMLLEDVEPNYSTHETLFRDLLEADLLKRRELAGYKDLWPMTTDAERRAYQDAWQYLLDAVLDPSASGSRHDEALDISKHTQRELNFQKEQALLAQIDALLSHVKAKLDLGFGVIGLGHSQGNLFLNEMYHKSQDEDLLQFALVGVASAASIVADSGPYTTLKDDRVINVVRRRYRETLPGNFQNPGGRATFLNHELEDAYLTPEASREQIRAHVKRQKKKIRDRMKKDSGASEECVSWFKKSEAAQLKGDECLLTCAQTSVSMATFDCPSQCRKLCKCYVQEE